MKKISKSMAKKIALMVMLSSAVGMHSVWAEGTNVQPEKLKDNKVVVTATGYTINGDGGTGVSPYGVVYGGYVNDSTSTNDVKNNTLTITGGEFKNQVAGGWTYGTGKVEYNDVTITGGTFTYGRIYGGYASNSGDVSNNTVTITGCEFSASLGEICGGCTTGAGKVSDNSVNITGGTIKEKVYGGYSSSGKALNNKVNITGGTISQTVYGGFAQSGNASGNTVMISGIQTSITSHIYGAQGVNDVNNNAVVITGGTYEGSSITGGYASGGNANNNQVVISGAAVVDNSKLQTSNIDIGGGYSYVNTAQTQENLVQVTTTTGHIRVKGLTGGNKTATKNTLVIGDTDVTTDYVKNFEKYYFCIPESAKDGDTLLNNETSFSLSGGTLYVRPKYSEEAYTVTLAKASDRSSVSSVALNLPEGNDVTYNVFQDGEYVKYSQTGIISWVNVVPGSLTNNVVEVTDDKTATVNGTPQTLKSSDPGETNWDNVYGGFRSAPGAYVMDNEVTVSGGTVPDGVCGGYSSAGTAMNNRVNISGGTVGSVYGGQAQTGTAKDNLVVISGGSISSCVYGGYTHNDGSAATGNTVVVLGGTFGQDSAIYAGYSSRDYENDTSNNTVQISAPITVPDVYGGFTSKYTGSTLIVDSKNVTATTAVSGFDTYAFYLPKDIGTTDAALKVTGGTVSLNSATIYVVPDYSWKAGDKYKLFSATSLTEGTYSIGDALAPGNKMTYEIPSVNVVSKDLVYTMGTISEWTAVQPSSLTGNKVELVANVSGKATAVVNDGTQTCISNTVSSSWANVYGGYSTMKGAYVANNTVTISSKEGIADTTKIYGGYAPNGTVENNTLEVTAAGVEVGSVDGFDNYNFTLPSTTETYMLRLSTSAYCVDDDFQGDTITVNLNGSELDSIILIENRFASILDGITLKLKDGETVLSDEDAKACFSVTSPKTGHYNLVFTNNLGVSLKPTEATGNIITITGDNTATGYSGILPPDGKTWKHVYGGYSDTGDVTGNTLTITAGTISGNVYAGYSKNPDATVSGNKLYWQGGTVKGGMIKGNEVTISGTEAKYLGTEGTIEADGAVVLDGILTVGDTDTASKLTFTSGVNIGKNGKLVVNDGSDVTLEKTSTLSGAIEGEKIINDGILNVDGSGKLTLAIAIAGDGTLNVESGTDLIYTGQEINNAVIIEQGATMDPDAGVFKKDVTNYGTLVLEGGNLGTKITNNGGTMKVTSPVTIDTNGAVTLDAGSTLAIAAANFTTDAAVKGITSSNFTLADGAKIKLTGETDDETYYMLLAGEKTAITDLKSKVNAGLVDEAGDQFTDSDVKLNDAGTAIIAKVSTLNDDEKNLNSLAGIQQGMVSMQNITVDTVAAHMGLINKAKGEGKYAKEIWASYLNNKDNVDGFNMAKYDAKYNGVTVGVDFYSSEKSVAGVALTYAKGDVSGNGIKSGIRNDSKYYGISFYDRVDLKNSALLMDLGYMNSKNETNVSTTKSVTGDAKVDSYTLGVRWEKDYQFKNSKLVPFAGVRYLRLNSKDFGNSRGLNYSTNSQNLFQPKIGVAWAGDYKMKDSAWNFKPKAEVGYLWALGNREADTALNYKGHDKGNVLYDVTDKSSYYAKLGIEFNKKNFAAGVDYSYMKGSSVRSNRWNVNLSWSF